MGGFLEIKDIHAGYGPIDALKGVSLVVNKGEIVTLIGTNGAGKTSTLACVSSIMRLRSGQIFFDGEDISKFAAHELVSMGIVQVPEGRKIFSRLSVLENLHMGAYTRNNPSEFAEDLAKVFELFPVLKERQSQLGGTLSGGEQQMLAISRALMSHPKLLLLDEPSMGVAPLLVAKIFEVIRRLNAQSLTILLVEQNAHLALKTAGRGYVMETGEIILSGNSAELLANPRVKEAYLGEYSSIQNF